MQAQHSNEFYNNGALVHIQAGAEVHVWGDVHMHQATGVLENNGLLKTQGNMYSDELFQQRGTGTTLIENSDVNIGERQFISGSYAVRGGTAQIGVNDGSFYNLELNNDQRAVYLVNSGAGSTPQYVADVRGSVNFDPQGLGPTMATNIVTHDIGTTGAISYPANGSNYAAEFGMMNAAAGQGNYINDTWHQSGNNNMSLQDNGYIIGKHRRAINAAGGTYGYFIGLDPDVATANNAGNKGFQYVHFVFGANSYDVISGYYQAGSPNNTMGAAVECSGYNMNDFWGDRHGEWIFDDINNVSSGGQYEIRVWPQDPTTPWSGTVWTISKDDVFAYPAPNPLHNDCGPTPTNLKRTGFEDFSAFGVLSGIILLESKIVDLVATPINNKFIKVDWSTSKEVNVDHFVIERSTDDANFSPITTHTATGNSQILQNYSIDDYAVLPNVNYYYRIKIVNTDGSVDYTHSVVAALVKDGNVQTINLFPNPIAEGNATLEITSISDKQSSIIVYDAIGQLIMSKEINVQKGLNTYSIATQDWPGGIYYVHINSAQSSTVKELIKTE
ncbi:T9SS type A sorting domain-containing protein [Aureispira anguillae]|nr:T9SS type A sorting domain-containing protein [Aureispira anguillae]